MNKVELMGRLTKDPEVRYSTGENATAIAMFEATDLHLQFIRQNSDWQLYK